MATTVISAELVRVDDPLDFTERAAIAGFLAGYTGKTPAPHDPSGTGRITPIPPGTAGYVRLAFEGVSAIGRLGLGTLV